MRRVPTWLRPGFVAGLVLASMSGPALAHGDATGPAAPRGAIAIPNLSHGQMSVIAANEAAIMDLAARQVPTDPIMRRLEGFINIQLFACMWGLMPGSVHDEASPFNECAHAYLAATRALLVHLQDMPGDHAAVRALVTKIETEMLLNRTALVLCQYSDEAFNTAEIIAPHWTEIPSHPPTALTLGGIATAAFAGTWLAMRTGRRWGPL